LKRNKWPLNHFLLGIAAIFVAFVAFIAHATRNVAGLSCSKNLEFGLLIFIMQLF
jgi:hypothetical protein